MSLTSFLAFYWQRGDSKTIFHHLRDTCISVCHTSIGNIKIKYSREGNVTANVGEHCHLANIAPGAVWCEKCNVPNRPPSACPFRGPLCACFSVHELQIPTTTTRGRLEMMVGQCWSVIGRLDKVHVLGRSYLKPCRSLGPFVS